MNFRVSGVGNSDFVFQQFWLFRVSGQTNFNSVFGFFGGTDSFKVLVLSILVDSKKRGESIRVGSARKDIP